MKLLFDNQISPRLVDRLSDIFPAANHVYPLGFDQADDKEIWSYAKTHDYIIVAKDSDFNDLSVLHGFPPKVVWLRMGNCTTDAIETTLRNHQDDIKSLYTDLNAGVLTLY
jgi:predicted nuclease of predicted toxin-antitoxin system